MSPRATLLIGGVRYPLVDSEPIIVRAGNVLVELEDVPARTAVRVDGRSPQMTWNPARQQAVLSLDLKRDTGFHELIVGPATFMFGTEDAKLRIDGVVKLLDYLGSSGLAWSGAMFFSGADQVLRDPRLDRAWLERRGNEIVRLIAAIAERPSRLAQRTRRRSDHGRPDVAATMRLLREHRDLLEEMDGGPIQFEHAGTMQTYAPREVIVRENKSVFDTAGNHLATALLDGTLGLAKATRAQEPNEARKELSALIAQLETLRLRHPFRSLRSRRSRLQPADPITAGEWRDPRYTSVHALHDELFNERHWSPQRHVMPERSYASFADSIYQRFCAQLLADHLDLLPTDDLPGQGKGPHFVGTRFQLYVDVKPPSSVIRDWRGDSDRKTKRRPDLVLHEPSTSRAAVLDVKYRAKGTRATRDSLSEVQLYMQAYSQKRVAVIFPPGPGEDEQRWKVHEVTDGTFCIYEVPFLPEPRMADFLRTQVDRVLEQLLKD
jgi:hypothetical protein